MNENDAFYNALIDVAAWDKENTLDRFMNSDSLFKKFLYKFITTDGSYVKLRSSLVERDLENAKLYSHEDALGKQYDALRDIVVEFCS